MGYGTRTSVAHQNTTSISKRTRVVDPIPERERHRYADRLTEIHCAVPPKVGHEEHVARRLLAYEGFLTAGGAAVAMAEPKVTVRLEKGMVSLVEDRATTRRASM